MDNLNQYRSDLNELTKLIDRLSNGELSIEELSTMEELTRRLHERSIILKYKAYENRSNNSVSEKVEQEDLSEEEVTEEEPTFDLSMFNVEEEFEEAEDEEEIEINMDDPATDVEESDEDEMEDEVEVEQTPIASSGTSFIDQLNLDDNSIASQFAGGKLESLVGAFGLNERLRFINNLFDGSSEMFSEAVKILDNQSDFNAAKQRIDSLASEHSWDPEDDTVLEFMNYVNRRYA